MGRGRGYLKLLFFSSFWMHNGNLGIIPQPVLSLLSSTSPGGKGHVWLVPGGQCKEEPRPAAEVTSDFGGVTEQDSMHVLASLVPLGAAVPCY